MEFAGTWFAETGDQIRCSETPVRNEEISNILVHIGPAFRMALTESQAEVLICQVAAKLAEIKRRNLLAPSEAVAPGPLPGVILDVDAELADLAMSFEVSKGGLEA